ncbi:MAG: YdeI/OmpD-associated family protein [Thermoanaerobaculia bacterium]
MASPSDLPVLLFKRPEDWAAWLDKNHESSSGIWMRLAKKASALESVTYAEALEEALRHGWIDGQKKAYDEESWLQKFTRRGKKSIWSKINREKAEELIRDGRMQPPGLAEVERARADGRWDGAYDSQKSAAVPEDFQAALDGNPRAKAFFATLESYNRYAILFRIQTAKKAETRARNIQRFIEMLERHEKVHPKRS